MARSIKLIFFAIMVVSLCGFDTDGLFKTSGPFRVTSNTIGGGSNPSPCTDGVDCYCDRVTNPSDPIYDANILLCEDFEHEDYYSDTISAGGHPWYKSPSGDNGYRGGDSRWTLNWGGGNGYWRSGNPASPTLGYTCTYGACGPAEWRLDNAWQGNSEACIDIQREGEADDEVATLTLDEHHDGNSWMAYRIKPGSTCGFVGEKSWSAVTHIGLVMRIAYSTNVGTNAAANYWKSDEYGNARNPFHTGNTGNSEMFSSTFPFNPSMAFADRASCLTNDASMTKTLGIFSCDSDRSIQGSPVFGTGAGQYSQAADWPLGTWGCLRAEMSGMGTSSMTWKIWFNDELIVHGQNMRGDLMLDTSINGVGLNAYSNANESGGAPDTTETSYRYQDNLHVTNGTPPTCASLGW